MASTLDKGLTRKRLGPVTATNGGRAANLVTGSGEYEEFSSCCGNKSVHAVISCSTKQIRT